MLVACSAVAGIWGVNAYQERGIAAGVEVLLCVLIVAVAAGAALVASAVDEQTIDSK